MERKDHFRENMIHVVKEAEKIRIFSVRFKSFVHSNDPYVLNRLNVNESSTLASSTNQPFYSMYDIVNIIQVAFILLL